MRSDPGKTLAEAVDQIDPQDDSGDKLMSIAGLVRDCADFEPEARYWHGETTRADCIGFTYVVDAAVERIGLDSRIAFCNSHAFNLVVDKSTEEIHMVNTESQSLWRTDIARNLTTFGMLAPSEFDDILETDRDISYYSLQTHRVMVEQHRLPWLRNNFPVLAVMQAEIGRRALYSFLHFSTQLSCGSAESIQVSIDNLHGCNPQIETRPRVNGNLRQFIRRIDAWSNDDSMETEQITNTINAYDEIMPYKTKSWSVFIGDCLRRIGAVRAEVPLLDAALDNYRTAQERSRSLDDHTLAGKVQKTYRELMRCRSYG